MEVRNSVYLYLKGGVALFLTESPRGTSEILLGQRKWIKIFQVVRKKRFFCSSDPWLEPKLWKPITTIIFVQVLRQASEYRVKTKEVSGLDAEPLKTNFYNCQNCPHKIGLDYWFTSPFFSALLKVAYESLWQLAQLLQ